MPRLYQMSDLRARALEQADLDGDQAFVAAAATPMVNGIMSRVYGRLYGRVCKAGCRYFEKSTTFPTDGSNVIAEPADHLSTVDVIERVVNTTTGKLRRLKPLEAQHRAYWTGRTGYARRWEFVNRQILLYPTPPALDQYVLRYIPQPPDLRNAADDLQVDVVNQEGEDYFVWACAYRFLRRIKSDVTLELEEANAAGEALDEWASLRAFNESSVIVRDDDEEDDWPWRDGEWFYDR